VAGQLMRPIELAVVLLCCFFGSFLYLDYKSKPFSNNYLILINITSYISILLTATRAWFIGFTLMYILYFLMNYKKVVRNVINLAIGAGIFLLVMYFVPQIKTQTDQSWTRLETIGQITKGNISESSLRERMSIRAPRVMDGFNKSTILFGAGFSDLYYEYTDGHVGFQNILLNSGIAGFFLVLSFALTLIFKPYILFSKLNFHPAVKSILRNLPLFMPTVLFINSGTQFWGYDVGNTARTMLLAFYISISSLYINIYQYSFLENRKGNKNA
jgi:hypothetical protein